MNSAVVFGIVFVSQFPPYFFEAYSEARHINVMGAKVS